VQDEVQDQETPKADVEEEILVPVLPQTEEVEPPTAVVQPTVAVQPAVTEAAVEVEPTFSNTERTVPSTPPATTPPRPIVRSYPQRNRKPRDWFEPGKT
jgi:hypothetical protein